jgi:hypothetical protein
MAKKAETAKTAKPTRKLPRWTEEEVHMLTALAGEQTKTTAIARKLRRSFVAVRKKASTLNVMLGRGRKKKKG